LRIVLVNNRREERENLVRLLTQRDFQVEAFGDEAAALLAIASQPPQIIVFGAAAEGTPDFVRRMKAADHSGQAYFITLYDGSLPSKELPTVLAAGVHDFMRRPLLEAEFVERVKAPGRVIRWAQALNKPAALDFSSMVDARNLRAWRNLGELIVDDLGTMIGQSLTLTDSAPKDFEPRGQVATIRMFVVADNLELKASIIAEPKTLAWVRTNLFGSPTVGEEVTADALREMANVVGGCLKRMAVAEGVSVAAGLPFNGPFPAAGTEVRYRTLQLDDDCRFVLATEMIHRESQRVRAAALTEGLVLTQDVKTETGVLLMPAGSRLTDTTVTKLTQLLGPHTHVDVCSAA
jgi:DNA-binding response OmpR family regulator